MSDTFKWLLWLIGLILLLWISLGVDSCRNADLGGWEGFLCNDCSEQTETPVAPPAEPVRAPVDFQAADTTAYTNPGYEEYRARILEGYKDGQILEITGDYFADEAAPPGYENMGFARAAAIRALLAPDIPTEKIILKSNLLSGQADGYFTGHSYQWIAEEVESVQEIDGCTIIRFAFNSSDGLLDTDIVASLDKIAARMIETGEGVQITGHTDNVGGIESNVKLGRNRARDIRKELINRRVPLSQISIDSKGMSEPVATNDTDRGRAENRRVEVCLEN